MNFVSGEVHKFTFLFLKIKPPSKFSVLYKRVRKQQFKSVVGNYLLPTMKLRFSEFLLLALSAIVVTQALDLNGFWEEDPSRRENLQDFLLAIKLGYIKRFVALKTTWRSSEDIRQTPSGYVFKSLVGPLYEKHDFILVPDNRTASDVDFGDLGGVLLTTSEIIGNSLMAYGVNKKTHDIDLVVNRTVFPNNPNLMRTTITQWKSKVSVVSYLNRAKY